MNISVRSIKHNEIWRRNLLNENLWCICCVMRDRHTVRIFEPYDQLSRFQCNKDVTSIQTRRYTKMKKIYRKIINRWLHSMDAMNPSLEGKTVLYWRIRWENLWENLIVDRPFAKKKTSHFYVSCTHQAVTKQCIKIDDDADQSASC